MTIQEKTALLVATLLEMSEDNLKAFGVKLNQEQGKGDKFGADHNRLHEMGFSRGKKGMAEFIIQRHGLIVVAKAANVTLPEGEQAAEQAPAATPKPLPLGMDDKAAKAAAILALLEQAPALDEEAVRKLVRDEMAQGGAKRIEVQVGTLPRVDVTDKNPAFLKVLAAVIAKLNVLMVGPAGSGKTTMAAHLAEALGLGDKWGYCSLTAGTSEGALVGRLVPIGAAGAFVHLPSRFLEIYEGGGVFLFDEVDAADPNMMLVVNAALANGHLEIVTEKGAVRLHRHKDCYLVAAANTFGTGADQRYVSRGQLDAATLDRFVAVSVDHDPRLAARIMGVDVPQVEVWEPTASLEEAAIKRDLRTLHSWLVQVADKCRANRLTREIGTRKYQQAAALRSVGFTVADVKDTLLNGWKADELSKVAA